jgi:acetylglutamate kinase
VRDAQGKFIQALNVESSQELIASGVAADGMAAKLESARAALQAGVDRVRICGLAGLADSERGTFITQTQGVAS